MPSGVYGAEHSGPRLMKMKVPHGLLEIPVLIDNQCFASVINAIDILSKPSIQKFFVIA